MKKYLLIAATLLPTVFISHNILANKTVFTPNTCSQIQNTTQPFLLIIKRGDDVVQSITQCAERAKISGFSFSGLGAVENPEFGYYNLKNKVYQKQIFKGGYELASLNGNVSLVNNKLFVHAHAVIGDENYQAYAGHLFSAKVYATMEVTMLPLQATPVRLPDKEVSLSLIKKEK